MQLPAIATIDQATALLGLLDQALTGVVRRDGGHDPSHDASQGAGPVEGHTAGQNCLQIDASGVREFDTSLLAWLLQAKRRCAAMGATVRLAGAPPKLTELARLYGVEDLLPLA